MKLTIEDGRDSFYTFDTNRILLLTATDEEQINQVEFSTEENGETVSWTSDVLTGEDGIKYVQVPNEFLNGNYSRLVCYYVALDSKGEYTRQKEVFRIRARQEPEDYFLTYSERVTFASIKALTEQYKVNASNSADLARRYAEESEDVNVETGTYSSKHWSAKSEKKFQEIKDYVGSTSDPESALGSIESARASAVSDVNKQKTDSIEAIRTYTSNTAIPSVSQYVEGTAKPALNTYGEQQVNSYVNGTSKPELDRYVNNEKKQVLDNYTAEKKSELDNYTETDKKQVLDIYTENEKKAELDSHTAGLKEQLNAHTVAKSGELNEYTTGLKSELDGYTTAKEQVISEFTEQKKTEVQGVYQTDLNELKGDIDDYIESVKKPSETNVVDLTHTGYVNRSGVIVSLSDEKFKYTDYIELPYNSYSVGQSLRKQKAIYTLSFWTKDKTFISGSDDSVTIIPDNAKYMILGSYTTITNKPHSNLFYNIVYNKAINKISNDVNALKAEVSIDISHINVAKAIKTFTNNTFIDVDGLQSTNNNFSLMNEYMEVEPNTSYKFFRGEPSIFSSTGHRWAFYDESKAYISYVQNANEFTTPNTCKYVRLSLHIDADTGSVTHENIGSHLSDIIVTQNLASFNNPFIKGSSSVGTLIGKKWLGIGDSITEENGRAKIHYHDYVKAELGLTFVNYGVSGSGYRCEGSGNQAFWRRVENIDTDADIITIFGGVNDMIISNYNIGTYTDKFVEFEETNPNSVCACVNHTIDIIEALYTEHMPLGVISPLPCDWRNAPSSVSDIAEQNPNNDECRMNLFCIELEKICKHRGIPYLDLFHASNLRPWNDAENTKYFSCNDSPNGDGMHPNSYGHRLFYRQIKCFLEKISN